MASTWGPKGFTGDVCAHGYVVGSCDGGLLRAGVPQVANESFGVFDVEATCLVEVPLVSGGLGPGRVSCRPLRSW
jgi:hypothetical protein